METMEETTESGGGGGGQTLCPEEEEEDGAGTMDVRSSAPLTVVATGDSSTADGASSAGGGGGGETAAPMDDEEEEEKGFGFLRTINTCGSCKEFVQNRRPKILSCLHTLCLQCINLLDSDASGNLKCPLCHQICSVDDVIDNVFVSSMPSFAGQSSASSSSTTDDAKICTGCEENVVATCYCVECTEWLCDQCEQAHRRVKVTKDHTIEPKEKAPQLDERRDQVRIQQLPCPLHPLEHLKLYCNTCSKLTCRDCQLVEHKEHKYQFLQEAANSFKEVLQTLLIKIKEKQTYIENAKNLINQRNHEIVQKEQAVMQEVKQFAMSLITDINVKGRQLITDLQSICSAKKRQLEQKDREIQLLSSNLEHGLKFAEYLLETGDDGELLYSRKTLAAQLRHILQTRCEVPNPYHVVDLRFASSQTFASSIPKLGCIIVDGIPFTSRSMQQASSANSLANGAMSGMSSGSRALSSAVLGGLSGSLPPLSQAPSGYTSASQMTNDQKMALLMSMRKSFDRQREQRRQQLKQQQMMQQQMMHQQQQQQLFQGQPSGRQDYGFGTQRLSHLPNQSSNISSSNLGHQQKFGSVGPYFSSSVTTAQVGYSSPALTSGFSGGQINLAQLQMRRQSDPSRQMNTSLQPIVIQPTGHYQSPSPVPQHLAGGGGGGGPFQESGISFARQLSTGRQPGFPSSSIKSTNSEALERPSCTSIKQEAKTFSMELFDLRHGNANLSRSRTPTPCIESTDLELLNEISSDFPNELCTSVTGASSSNDSNKLLSNWTDVASDASSGPMGADFVNADHTSASLDDSLCLMESSVVSPLPDVLRMRSADDPSDDYCAVCRNGGDLLCCDGCPKVFHLGCHIHQLTDAPSGQWYCGLCTKEETLRMESADVRPASGSGLGNKRRYASGLTNREQRVCERLLLELFCHEASVPFHEPVSKSVPNYYRMITNPMDFSTIRGKLTKSNFHHYQCLEDFIADVRLVFANCQKFNHPETEIGKAGRAVEEFLEDRVGQLLPFLEFRSLTPASDHSDGRSSRSKRRRANGLVKSGSKKSSLSSADGESLDGEEELSQLDLTATEQPSAGDQQILANDCNT